ncbi:MAG: VUT family protein [Rhodospirillales bacterium]
MQSSPFPRASLAALSLATVAMIAVIALSNYLVQFVINDWLTYAAFSFPLTFLVTDLVNRRFGPGAARVVVAIGFLVAAILSLWLAPWRIAAASASAFLVSQLLDVQVFDRLRRAQWWLAPLVSSSLGSLVDTLIFFSIAFAGSGIAWLPLAAGDLAVKLAFALLLLAPFRALMSRSDASLLSAAASSR